MMTTLANKLNSKVVEIVHLSHKRVYSRAELSSLYSEISAEWELHKKPSPNKLADSLIKQGVFQEIKLTSTYTNIPKRYSWGKFSLYELALSLQKNAYLSHGTAAYLHSLIEQEPPTIYVNKEQSIKSHSSPLTQQTLTMAFSGKQRQSQYVFRHGKSRITILSGKNTARLGVQKIQGKQEEILEITGIERTLIDITVRPAYAGGVNQVLQCFMNARNMVAPSKLIEILEKLEYVYPYHQAIGFYMQKAGFPRTSWATLIGQGLHYDFFLAHGIKKRLYNPDWRIFYPADFPV